MNKRKLDQISNHISGYEFSESLRSLSHQVVHFASLVIPRVDFLREVSTRIIRYSGCNAMELLLKIANEDPICEFIVCTKSSFKFKITHCTPDVNEKLGNNQSHEPNLIQLYRNIISRKIDPNLPYFTPGGSFWTGNIEDISWSESGLTEIPKYFIKTKYYKSIIIISLMDGDKHVGLLKLKSRRKNFFTKYETESYEDFAKTFGVVLMNQRAHAALRERVKELTCLYGISKVVAQPDISLKDILLGIADLLPPGWQYPEITCGRIILDGHTYNTKNFKDSSYKQSADIVVGGVIRGKVEVIYTEKKPTLDEGPFLREERNLIDAIAKQVALIIERRQADEEKLKLQEQLRHADRLATIGQLSAGVAHELNEPLGNILGFAQLTKKYQGLTEQAEKDIDKIIAASLHAREVIQKLMLFARQMPPQKIKVDINKLIQEGLYFLESRCAKEGIKLVRTLASNIPEITADKAQLHQVLMNIVVNAVQAMPNGGTLTIKTLANKDTISIIVQDTGIGMSKEIINQIFIPFFTTKDVGDGTGIGLSVVHGIITSHGGSIKVESEVGRGSRFEIQLPVKVLEKFEEND